MPTERLVDELFAEIDRYYAAGKKVQRDEARAAEAREWLAENEDDDRDDARADRGDGGGRGAGLDEETLPVAGRPPPVHPGLKPRARPPRRERAP